MSSEDTSHLSRHVEQESLIPDLQKRNMVAWVFKNPLRSSAAEVPVTRSPGTNKHVDSTPAESAPLTDATVKPQRIVSRRQTFSVENSCPNSFEMMPID